MAVVLFSLGPSPLNRSTSGAQRAVLEEEFPADQFSTVIEAINVTVSDWNINWKALLAYMYPRVFI